MRHSTEFEVNLNLLAENFHLLRDFAPDNKVIFMVKSNAYGHGLIEVSDFAVSQLNIERLGVASLGEALYLRNKAKEKAEVWVFSDTEVSNEKVNQAYTDQQIVPVIASKKDLIYFLSHDVFKEVALVLKFDTGMNRLGIPYKDVDAIIELLKEYNVKSVQHLMTHFSQSFIKLKKGDRTHQQYEKFQMIKKKFEQASISYLETSCANSGAIEQSFGLEETHIRPGLMLYGPRSVGSFHKEEALWKGKTISKLKTKILCLKEIKKGAPIGYGGHICHADGVVAFLPLGYGDGILTYYSGLKIKHKSFTGQIIGRVNMDLIALFFEGKRGCDFNEGDEVIIWSHEQDDVVDLASQVKSIPYQVFTAITHRVPKFFKYQ